MGKILLLTIGINQYPHLPKNKQLDFCENDAKLIHDSYSLYDCEYNKCLIGRDATRENILKALKDIKNISRDDDYFIFSFAGHGITEENQHENINSKNTYICPSNTDKKYIEETTISLFELKESFSKIKANKKLQILDACHSGGALRRNLNSNIRSLKTHEIIQFSDLQKGDAIITACDSDEYAQENPNLSHGIFTHSLIETLKEVNEKKTENFLKIYEKVLKKVQESTQNQQNPKYKLTEDDFEIPTLYNSKIKNKSITNIMQKETKKKKEFSIKKIKNIMQFAKDYNGLDMYTDDALELAEKWNQKYTTEEIKKIKEIFRFAKDYNELDMYTDDALELAEKWNQKYTTEEIKKIKETFKFARDHQDGLDMYTDDALEYALSKI